MTPKLKLVWAFSALMLCSTVSFGQAKKGDFVTGAMTQSAIGWGGNAGLVVRGDLGLQGGYMLTDRFEVGASLQGALAATGWQQGVIKTWDAGVYGRYYFTDGKWQPYIFGGLSMGGGEFPINSLEGTLVEWQRGTQVRAHFGAGIQYWAAKNLAIFGEVQFQQVLGDVSGNFNNAGGSFRGPTLGVRWNVSGHNRMKAVPKE